MPYIHRIVVIGLLFGCGTLPRAAGGDWTTIYGAAREEAPGIQLLDPQITEIVLADSRTSHEDPPTPEFLGVLRIGDLPHNLALAYPRAITFVEDMPEAYTWTRQLYEKLGAGDRVRVIGSMRDWRPR